MHAFMDIEKITTQIDDTEVTIYFEYFPAMRGIREHGIQMTEDFPERVEFYKIIPLTFSENDPRISEAVWDWINTQKEETFDGMG